MTIHLLNKSVSIERNILSFLLPEERGRFSQVNRAWKKAEDAFFLAFFPALKAQIAEDCFGDESCHLFIQDETGKRKASMGCVLGKGGSKKAIKIQKTQEALIVCNLDSKSVAPIAAAWKRIVHEEVAMSDLLTSLGMLSPQYKRVNISLSPVASEGVIPAYTSPTFSALGSMKGWFIMDLKIANSSTWKRQTDFLFKNPEERLVDENWDSVMDSMLTDIAKICVYGIPINRDSFNLVVVKKPSKSESVSEFEVRFFGFDFSERDSTLAIPKLGNIAFNTESAREKLDWPLSRYVDYVFWYEFGNKYELNVDGMRQTLIDLRERLKERYAKVILSRIEKILKESEDPKVKS